MPSVKFPDKQITELRAFVTLLKAQPSVLHQPELQFLKEYIESLGGEIPHVEKPTNTEIPKSCPAHESHATPKPAATEEEPELVESDVELDQTGVIGLYRCKLMHSAKYLMFSLNMFRTW